MDLLDTYVPTGWTSGDCYGEYGTGDYVEDLYADTEMAERHLMEYLARTTILTVVDTDGVEFIELVPSTMTIEGAIEHYGIAAGSVVTLENKLAPTQSRMVTHDVTDAIANIHIASNSLVIDGAIGPLQAVAEPPIPARHVPHHLLAYSEIEAETWRDVAAMAAVEEYCHVGEAVQCDAWPVPMQFTECADAWPRCDSTPAYPDGIAVVYEGDEHLEQIFTGHVSGGRLQRVQGGAGRDVIPTSGGMSPRAGATSADAAVDDGSTPLPGGATHRGGSGGHREALVDYAETLVYGGLDHEHAEPSPTYQCSSRRSLHVSYYEEHSHRKVDALGHLASSLRCAVTAAQMEGVHVLEETLVRGATAAVAICRDVFLAQRQKPLDGIAGLLGETRVARLHAMRLRLHRYSETHNTLDLSARDRIYASIESGLRSLGLADLNKHNSLARPAPKVAAEVTDARVAYIVVPPGTGKTALCRAVDTVREANGVCDFTAVPQLMTVRERAAVTGDWSVFNRAWAVQLRARCEDGDVILVPDAVIGELMGAQFIGAYCLSINEWRGRFGARVDKAEIHEACYRRASVLAGSSSSSGYLAVAVAESAADWRQTLIPPSAHELRHLADPRTRIALDPDPRGPGRVSVEALINVPPNCRRKPRRRMRVRSDSAGLGIGVMRGGGIHTRKPSYHRGGHGGARVGAASGADATTGGHCDVLPATTEYGCVEITSKNRKLISSAGVLKEPQGTDGEQGPGSTTHATACQEVVAFRPVPPPPRRAGVSVRRALGQSGDQQSASSSSGCEQEASRGVASEVDADHLAI